MESIAHLNAYHVTFFSLFGLIVFFGLCLFTLGFTQQKHTETTIKAILYTTLAGVTAYILSTIFITVNPSAWIPSFTFNGDFYKNMTLPQDLINIILACIVISSAAIGRVQIKTLIILCTIFCGLFFPILQGIFIFGGMAEWGFHTFASTPIMCVAAAMVALATTLHLKPRPDALTIEIEDANLPSNIPSAIIGTLLVAIGLAGFTHSEIIDYTPLGSPIDLELAQQIFVNSIIGFGSAFVAAYFLLLVGREKTNLTLLCGASIAGVIAITAAPIDASKISALAIGASASILMLIIRELFLIFKVDDPAQLISIFTASGVCGLTGVAFASNDAYLLHQLVGIVTIIAIFFIIGWATWAFTKDPNIDETAEKKRTLKK
jgi:ammonium transporter, Amt family